MAPAACSFPLGQVVQSHSLVSQLYLVSNHSRRRQALRRRFEPDISRVFQDGCSGPAPARAGRFGVDVLALLRAAPLQAVDADFYCRSNVAAEHTSRERDCSKGLGSAQQLNPVRTTGTAQGWPLRMGTADVLELFGLVTYYGTSSGPILRQNKYEL